MNSPFPASSLTNECDTDVSADLSIANAHLVLPDTHSVRRNHDRSSSISYSHSAQSETGFSVIKILENATARIRLIRHAQNYDQEISEENASGI